MDDAVETYLTDLAEPSTPTRSSPRWRPAPTSTASRSWAGPPGATWSWPRGVGARRVMELGSGYGYSAYWFARAVGPDGEVVCTDGDPDNAARRGVPHQGRCVGPGALPGRRRAHGVR